MKTIEELKRRYEFLYGQLQEKKGNEQKIKQEMQFLIEIGEILNEEVEFT